MKQFRVVLCVVCAATLLGVVAACSNIFGGDSSSGAPLPGGSRTVAVSGNLAGSIGAASLSAQQSIEGADTVVTIPVSSDEIRIDNIRRAREGTINEDGSFSIDIPVRNGSWIVLAIDSEATGFDRLVGHMVIDEDTARLHTLPIDNAEEDLELGTMSFDEDAQEFVAEHGMSAYAGSMNLSVAQLRDIARTDSMSKLAINLYLNYTPDDYWEIMTVWIFQGYLAQAIDSYAPASGLEQEIGITYSRFTWETPSITIDDITSGAAHVAVYPPVDFTVEETTYGPSSPFQNTDFDENRSDDSEEENTGQMSYHFDGGLTVTTEHDGSIGFDVRSIDPDTQELVPGVWRVEIDGETRAWFDVRIGSPFDPDGNLIALLPEPRLSFSEAGLLERFDTRFVQQTAFGSYESADSAAQSQIQWGQMQLRTSDGPWDKIDDAYAWDFNITPDHPHINHHWYRNSADIPEGADDTHHKILGVAIATRAYGEDFAFWFSRD